MKLPQLLDSPVGRIAKGAAAGAVLTVVAGQLMSWLSGTCLLVCQPEVAAPFGGFIGAIAFFNVGRD